MFEAFLTSTILVAVAEIGDKTQLLSFVLAARLRKPGAIIAGIFVATVLNHALAGSVGVWLAQMISPQWLPWITGMVFIAFGLWTLHPDSLDDDPKMHKAGAFVTTTIAFFIAEMGDKTQLATIALGRAVSGRTGRRRHGHHHRHDAGQRAGRADRRQAGAAAAADHHPLDRGRALFIATGALTIWGAPGLTR